MFYCQHPSFNRMAMKFNDLCLFKLTESVELKKSKIYIYI